MIQKFKSFLSANAINSSGKSVSQKLVIIESDDWGAIRTPSLEVLKAFEKKGLDIGKSIYKVDALESQDDLELLFDVLSKHKDSNNESAKITANAIMGNPDFDKIAASNFTEFHYERFTETFKKYPKHKNNLALYNQGQSECIFHPQLHGREHLQYKRWLRVLQSNNEPAHFCFKLGATYSGQGDYSFMEAYDWDSPTDIPEQIEVLQDATNIFRETFGYSSKSFIAPCYNWDPLIEPVLKKNGVTWLQGIRSQMIPTGTFEKYTPLRHYFGKTNSIGLRYNVRNCFFEPSIAPERDFVNSCLAQISNAFFRNKPAVICSHRINYVGFINEKNRDRGLHDLDQLLKAIVKKWPDVRFITTDQLSQFTIV